MLGEGGIFSIFHFQENDVYCNSVSHRVREHSEASNEYSQIERQEAILRNYCCIMIIIMIKIMMYKN